MRSLLAVLVVLAVQPVAPALARSHSLLGSAARYVNSSGRSTRSPKRSLLGGLGSSAKCRDGTSSYSRHAAGTCSGHGGVSRFH